MPCSSTATGYTHTRPLRKSPASSFLSNGPQEQATGFHQSNLKRPSPKKIGSSVFKWKNLYASGTGAFGGVASQLFYDIVNNYVGIGTSAPKELLHIIGEANDGKEAIIMATELKPDVKIMDISMPFLSGIEATKRILDELPNTKILALTQHEDNVYVMQMLNAGAYGYLLKNSST